MGRYAEYVARQVMTDYGRVTVARGTQIVRHIPDFLLRSSNGIRVWVEVKWNLPWQTGQALTRLVGQVTEAWSTKKGQVVVWTLREPTLRQLQLVHTHLGALAARTQFVHGVEGLYRWLRFYFG